MIQSKQYLVAAFRFDENRNCVLRIVEMLNQRVKSKGSFEQLNSQNEVKFNTSIEFKGLPKMISPNRFEMVQPFFLSMYIELTLLLVLFYL